MLDALPYPFPAIRRAMQGGERCLRHTTISSPASCHHSEYLDQVHTLSDLRLPKSRKVFRLIRSGIHNPRPFFQEHDTIMLGTLKHRRTQPRSAAAETTTVARTRAMRTGKQNTTIATKHKQSCLGCPWRPTARTPRAEPPSSWRASTGTSRFGEQLCDMFPP